MFLLILSGTVLILNGVLFQEESCVLLLHLPIKVLSRWKWLGFVRVLRWPFNHRPIKPAINIAGDAFDHYDLSNLSRDPILGGQQFALN